MLDYLLNADHWILRQINSVLSHPWLDDFFIWITDLHKTPYFKIIVIPLLAFFFIKKYKREGLSLFLILIFSLSVSDFVGGRIKHLFERERPPQNQCLQVIQRTQAGGYSFYSNHASNMFTFASYTSNFLPPLKLPLYTLATLVAYSRIYNGVHFPSDVFTGGFMGYLWGLLFSKIAKQLLSFLKNRKQRLK